MPSSTSNFNPLDAAASEKFSRTIPDAPWRSLLLATLAIVALALIAWEIRNRAAGYAPTLNDTPDLWAENRERVTPGSIVIIGSSRGLFGLDLDLLEQGLGQRPVQLCIVGSTPFPILAHFAADETFNGTLIVDLVPAMYFAPGGPLVQSSERALQRHQHWNHSQRLGHHLGKPLERTFTFLNQEDLVLPKLLEKIAIPNRPHAQIGPALPPYFYTLGPDRRARMVEQAATVGHPLQQRVAEGWLPLFTPPPPPSYVNPEAFGQNIGAAIEARYRDTAAHVATLHARGGRVIFLRMPSTGPLHAHEENTAPRSVTWDRILNETGALGIHFADHPELAHFECPEWSHLSASDSVEFTRRLIPHLQEAIAH